LNIYLTFEVIFFATSLSLVLGPIACRLAPKLGLLDDPNSAPHKVHAQLTPFVGGIILLITTVTISILKGSLRSAPIPAILVSSLIIFGFGLWDDYKNLSPLWKMIGQLMAASLLIFMGLQVNLFQQNWMNIVITLFWMVGITNAYNIVDSMDGLATGLACLASAFFMLITIESGQLQLSLYSTILLGACMGVFYYNAPPARIFLGDSGTQLLGFILGALAMAYNPVGFSRLSSWYLPILLMGVPIFDTILVVLSRLRRGTPIYQAGRDHTYHRLVSLGMSSNRSVLTMHIAALLLGALAFIALDLDPWVGNTIFGLVLVTGAAWVIFLDTGFIAPD
jgi:UDP-GlcNAc:undecaprenyl-phosphate/decaprenyl-phosphate GlcNAc-1-phosphate transferase